MEDSTDHSIHNEEEAEYADGFNTKMDMARRFCDSGFLLTSQDMKKQISAKY